MTVDDINPYLDAAEAERVRKFLKAARYEGMYTPESLTQDQITFPGVYGGAGWGAAAGDPQSGMVYIRAENTIEIHRLMDRLPRPSGGGSPEQQGRANWTRLCEGCHGSGAAGLQSLKGAPPDRIRTMVREGNGRMPSLGPADLDEQGLTRLLAYIANPAAGAGQPPPAAAAQQEPAGPPPPSF